MKSKWIWTVLGTVPFLAAVVSMQSCGGEGGPVGGDGGGGLPSITQAFLDLQSPEQRTASAVGPDTCSQAACHGSGAGSQHETWLLTKHAERNVTCERCHGNGSVHAASPSKTNILTFPRSVSPIVCAQCHGPIYEDYQQSAHYHIVEHPVADGVTSPAQYGRTSRCMECHAGLYRVQTYEQGVDPVNLADADIAAIAANVIDVQNKVDQSANCATCHDPHAKTGNLNADGEEVQLRHSTFSTDTSQIAPGTTAQQFTTFNHACGECHNGRAADGSDAKLSQSSSTSRPNMHDSPQFNTLMGIGGSEGPAGPPVRNMAHAQAPGQCTHCHMPDARHTFTVSYDKGCAPCHTAADAAARQQALTLQLTTGLISLRTRLATWAQTTFTAATPGYTAAEMDPRLFPFLWDYSSNISTEATELGLDPNNAAVMPPTTHQNSIPIEIRRARHNYYFIIRDGSVCPHNPPYARYLLDWANQNLDSLGVPPGGLDGRAPHLSLKQMQQIIASDRERAMKADLTPSQVGS